MRKSTIMDKYREAVVARHPILTDSPTSEIDDFIAWKINRFDLIEIALTVIVDAINGATNPRGRK